MKLFQLKASVLNLYSIIAEDVSCISANILSQYGTKKDDLNINITKYIQYSVFEQNTELNKLLVEFLSVETNPVCAELITLLNADSAVVSELMHLKLKDAKSCDADFKKHLAVAQKEFANLGDVEKKLFKNAETYAKVALISQIDATPTKLDALSAPLKAFFAELKKDPTIASGKQNNGGEVIKNIVEHSNLKIDEVNPSFTKLFDAKKKLNNFIIQKIITPVVTSMLALVNVKDAKQIKEINDYASLKFSFSAKPYFSILMNHLVYSPEYKFSTAQIDVVEKVLYLESLAESFKKDIEIRPENYTKNLNVDDAFAKLDAKNKPLYEEISEYQQLCFFNTSQETDYKAYLVAITEVLQEAFDEQGNLELDVEEDDSYLNTAKKGLLSAYNAARNNPGTTVLAVSALIFGAMFCANYRKEGKIEEATKTRLDKKIKQIAQTKADNTTDPDAKKIAQEKAKDAKATKGDVIVEKAGKAAANTTYSIFTGFMNGIKNAGGAVGNAATATVGKFKKGAETLQKQYNKIGTPAPTPVDANQKETVAQQEKPLNFNLDEDGKPKENS